MPSDLSGATPQTTEIVTPPFFSATRVSGDCVFVSGQMAFDAHFRIVGNTVEEQTTTCIRRIEQLLQPHHIDIGDIVKTTVWLTRIEDFRAFDASYRGCFAGAEAPARSTVRADLMVPGALVEIEAIARRPAADRSSHASQ